MARWYVRFPRHRIPRRVSLVGMLISFTVWLYICGFILMLNVIWIPVAGTIALVRAARANR